MHRHRRCLHREGILYPVKKSILKIQKQIGVLVFVLIQNIYYFLFILNVDLTFLDINPQKM